MNNSKEGGISGIILDEIAHETETKASQSRPPKTIDEVSIARRVLKAWSKKKNIKQIAAENGLPIEVANKTLKRIQKIIVRKYGNLR